MGAARPEPGDPVRDLRFPRSRRIRRGPEIRDLFRRGKRAKTSHLDLFVSASPVSRPRMGIVVPKHRHTVAERNRLRRRLREIGRVEVLPRLMSAGRDLDLLVRARPEAYGAPFEVLLGELVRYAEALCSGR
jgi:ribonuclease P protein component